MTGSVVPNEIAQALGVTGLQLRNWLRAQKAAGHPLLSGHQHQQRWTFTRAEADQLMAEFRAARALPRAGTKKPAVAADAERGGTDAVQLPLPRQSCTPAELGAALHALDGDPRMVAAADWPADLEDLDSPGLYSWWVDADGAQDLGSGLGIAVPEGRIYAGLTGATRWPSGRRSKMTLRTRIGGNHLGGRIRGSTFRLTLAACLAEPLGLRPAGSKLLADDGEEELSRWIRRRLTVAVHPFPNADCLSSLEAGVLRRLDPPLNLDGMAATALRTRVAELRSRLA